MPPTSPPLPAPEGPLACRGDPATAGGPDAVGVLHSGAKYRGLDPYRGVIERLRRVGFSVYRVDRGYGVYAVRL